uniref:Protein kinase domain-containing protein n=1 Tax=Nymphaea colorata TaxID=210225 RepID=A0A5K0ZFG1_9MAGN
MWVGLVGVEEDCEGTVYLHHDSAISIIDRDLKAATVLVDDQMNIKISDFGMMRIINGNQTQLNTKIIVVI